MSGDEFLEVSIPAGASEAEEEQLVQAAIRKKIDDDIDDALGGFGGVFK